ncbi:MAG TPA: hypothetical protein DEA70_03520 [Acidimicrobiaceae bacterium]|nr:hypothetical protein [Acidimicrobiaceae bacterium]
MHRVEKATTFSLGGRLQLDGSGLQDVSMGLAQRRTRRTWILTTSDLRVDELPAAEVVHVDRTGSWADRC